MCTRVSETVTEARQVELYTRDNMYNEGTSILVSLGPGHIEILYRSRLAVNPSRTKRDCYTYMYTSERAPPSDDYYSVAIMYLFRWILRVVVVVLLLRRLLRRDPITGLLP